MSEDGPYRRRAARVLLIDEADRILLFRFDNVHGRPELGHCWLTPGGGVEDGEPLRDAAARELREETGLRVAPDDLGPLVATASGHADLGWAEGIFRDDFFLHRTGSYEVDTSGFGEVEQKHISGHRWWTVDELTATSETVYPLELAALLADLLGGRLPEDPVRLPWHH